MTNTEIKHLFNYNRFPNSELKLICFVLYLPFGIVLLLLRLLLIIGLILLGYVLPDSTLGHKVVNKIACLCLGITVSIESEKKKENVDVYVSNNVSIFDQLAMHSAVGCVSPGSTVLPIKSKGLGVHYFENQANFETFKKNVALFLAETKTPLYFTPEGKITNGRALLKFKSYPFQFSSKIQPVCVSIDRPLLNISVSTIGSTYLNDVFYFMLSPLTNYKLKFLPSLEKKSLSDSEFAECVRLNITADMKVESTNYTESDLLEYEKQFIINLQRGHVQHNRPTPNQELRRMSAQVKEVLPHVPLDVIYNDLCKTKSVDTTITNILEGRVRFIPERNPSTSQPSTSNSNYPNSSANQISLTTSASSFPKSASLRSKSFQERKEQLIANARRRYIEKHNLDIPFRLEV